MTRAWTLGYAPAYDKAIRIPGNAKAPGGYAFRTRDLAVLYSVNHFSALGYEPYEIVLPRPFSRATTRDYMTAARARHRWHRDEMSFMPECGVCVPRLVEKLDCDLLVVQAPLINPDTSQPA